MLSPSMHPDLGQSSGSATKPIFISSPSISAQPLVSKLPWNTAGTSVFVPPGVKDLVAGLSDAIRRSGSLPSDGSKKMAETSRASVRLSSRIGRNPLDFTPPSFDLMSLTTPADEATLIPESHVPKDVSPISFAIPRGSQAADLDDEKSLEIDQLDAALTGLVSKVQFASEGEKSKTPKENPHKTRVKRPSRFVCSPFDESIQVTAEQQDVYDKLMTCTTKSKTSNIKTMKIIDYKTIFVETQELANDVHPRGELSNNLCEVVVHYMQETNKVEGKVILTYLIADYMMTGNNLQMRIIANAFERSNKFALSCQDRIYFPVLEIVDKDVAGGHWYALCLNLVAQRFEAPDSIRDAGNICLEHHATRLIGKIKEAWSMYYHKSSVQIRDYKLVIIDVPKQGNCKDCGFFKLSTLRRGMGKTCPNCVLLTSPRLGKSWPTSGFLLSSTGAKTGTGI
ncbi:uncharacterized protein LOC100830705 isoform X1 [Brachypodium distachyon]|uniref:uncharacterized protein LOC100830705 isoform X1 n=1 Tax=Brachypodium distachyon TaxID=15368 RepID=UPI00071CEE4A|nr:uncharacterized protein LOC100830705 isoform X1 [Brachypodium distachyon]|eukprot:XP_014753317.1 uncharacterized protein LOC100830705 isoform X1 [Brachypodium distachyon]